MITRWILSGCEPSKSGSEQPEVKARNSSIALALCVCSLSVASLLSVPAAAHLGGDANSVDTDRQVLHARLRSVPMQQYNLHEIRTQSGALLHEYETRGGTVFAVTWQGPLPPDLRQLFGNYYSRYQTAASAKGQPGLHRQLNIAGPELVVQSTARPRAFMGRAYIPSLVPAGVSIADLQ
jgi:Protein of unknown function (DUF2844)